jgi:hypothetical protein
MINWIVSKDEQKPAILHVEPISNSIFRTTLKIQLPDIIFDAIANGERSVKELFRVYKMHDLIFQWNSKNEKVSQTFLVDTDTKLYGHGWFVENQSGTYFFEFIKSAQGGGGRRIQISGSIYRDIRDNGKEKSVSLILDQYGLRDQDISLNDVADDFV